MKHKLSIHIAEAFMLVCLMSVSCNKEDDTVPAFMPCTVEKLSSTSMTISFTADIPDDGDTYHVGASLFTDDDPMLNFFSCTTKSEAVQTGKNTYTYSFYYLATSTTFNVRSWYYSDETRIRTWGDMIQVTTEAYVPDEIVDLGLSVKWRGWNLGASKPEEAGLYYQWGDTVGYGSDPSDGKYFGWADKSGNPAYKWCNGSQSTLTKYCNNSTYGKNGFTDNKTTLEAEDDAARVALGGNWRLPTNEEYQELRNKCRWKRSELNGVPGLTVFSSVEGYKDKYIFLPITGNRMDDVFNVSDRYNYTFYWTSSTYSNYPFNVYAGSMNPDAYGSGTYPRYIGGSIRPVTE